MKEILGQMIASFHETPFRELMARELPFPDVPGKANVVIGMRRAGKTSFCLRHLAELAARGVPKERMVYLNFENIRLLDFTWRDFPSITDVYYGMFPALKSELCYFVFDEIQRIEHWEAYVRGLLDEENARVVLTGSSSKLLSAEIGTALRGRAYTAELAPFSFSEFLRFHGIFRKPPARIGAVSAAKLRRAMAAYFRAGGFPECQLYGEPVREDVLRDYVDAAVFRDVVERHRVANLPALRRLVAAVLNGVGQKFSVSKFSAALRSMGIKCGRGELYAFLDYLADAFLIFKVPVYSRSVRVVQVNPVKIYAADPGLVRANARDPDAGRGALLENVVYLHLRRRRYEAAYGTAANGGEIDFIAGRRGDAGKVLIQVCFSLSDPGTRRRELAAFEGLPAGLRGARKILVTWDEEGRAGDVEILPVWRFLIAF